MNRHKHSDLFEHEADASYNMEVCDGRSASFVVIDEFLKRVVQPKECWLVAISNG